MRLAMRVAAIAVPTCAALALTTSGPTFAGSGTTGTTSKTTTTTFAFRSSGFGTRVVGGMAPAGSSTTGTQVIGCTNRAGRDRTNSVASVDLPGAGTAYGVKTHVWTTERDGVVASHSTHSVASLVLAQSQLGSLSVDGIRSASTAWHDDSGFHATTATHVGSLTFTPAAGPAQTLDLPTPDQPLAIPGFGTVFAGSHVTHDSATGSVGDAYALRIDLDASATSIQVAHSRATLNSGLVSGIFGGRSAATHVITAVNGIAKSGPNPLSVMPCQGTYGKTISNSLASVDLGGQVVVSGANSSVRGEQGSRNAHGYTRSSVSEVSLGGGQVVVDGIVGKASVRRTDDGVTKSAEGTRLGTVTVAGQEQTFPDTGVLEIPGVAKLERAVVTKSRAGIAVIGLRITLLDGSGAVIDLAEAELNIRDLS